MNIDSIENGLVIDHIDAGKGMEIVKLLELEKMTTPVAVIRNVRSNKMGKKDIIKIENETDINLDVLGFIDPQITVNVIKNGKKVEKKSMNPPEEVVNVVKCKNPRCITTTERELAQRFRRQAAGGVYRCVYCETEYTPTSE